MKSILYIQVNNNEIPEMDLYQIFLKVYKDSTSDKEIALFRVYKTEDGKYEFAKIFRTTDKNKNDKISIKKEEVIVDENNTIEEAIENYLNRLKKKYEVYIILSDLGQARLLGKYLHSILTLKKEELVPPLLK